VIIDVWTQHPTSRMLDHPMLDSLKRWTRGDGALAAFSSGEPPIGVTLRAMDDGGVALALLSAWVGPQGALISNDEVAASVAASPDRLVGIGSVDLASTRQAVLEVRRCVRTLGFKGIRALPWLWQLPPTHARFYPVYSECCELGVPFCTQVGHTGPLMPSEYGRPIPYIDQVALDFPELVIVCGHIGYPWTDEMIALAWKHEHVYIDTSAYLPRYYPPQLLHFMNTYGQDKVLFGSNFPMLDLKQCAEQARALELKPAAKAKFLAGNARRVFRLS
jgi:predicted TIM-barrel fold metal-dependent hydrolase